MVSTFCSFEEKMSVFIMVALKRFPSGLVIAVYIANSY